MGGAATSVQRVMLRTLENGKMGRDMERQTNLIALCVLLEYIIYNMQGKIVYDEEGMSYYEGDWKDHLRHGKGYRRYRFVNVWLVQTVT